MNIKHLRSIAELEPLLLQAVAEGDLGLIVVPNANYLHFIPQAFSGVVLQFEGIDLQKILPNFKIDVLSRNETYALIVEIVKKTQILNLTDAEIGIFARAMIGELPNVSAWGLTPQSILNKIPARIATAKEINIQAFVEIWQAFENLVSALNKVPYYLVQKVCLEKLVDYCKESGTKIGIIGDGGKSAVYCKFIESVTAENVCGLAFLHGQGQVSQPENALNITKCEIDATVEFEEVAQMVQFALRAGHKKVGIVCVDEALGQNVCQELKAMQIDVSKKNTKKAEENVLIRIFGFIVDRKIQEVLPILKISNKEKKEILNAIVQENKTQVPIWLEIQGLVNASLNLTEKIQQINQFIKKNLSFFYCNEADFKNLQEFVTALLKEIANLEEFGIKAGNVFFWHFVLSWKNWEQGVVSDVQVALIEEVYLKNYDAIVLTSKARSEEGSNMIFSKGLRKYFGFSGEDFQMNMLKSITCAVFTGKGCVEFKHVEAKTVKVESVKVFAGKKKEKNIVVIEKQEVPQKISATALETLIASAEKFYYKYVKCLRVVNYVRHEPLELGNSLHKVLEVATQNNGLNGKLTQKTIESLIDDCGPRAIFYEKALKLLIAEINQKKATYTIKAESAFEINLGSFLLTAKCDRVDEGEGRVVIYDYKSGSSVAFKKNAIVKNFEKIQLFIPALALWKENVSMQTKYYFLQNKDNNEVSVEITKNLLETFEEFAENILNKYLTQAQPIELEGGYGNFG